MRKRTPYCGSLQPILPHCLGRRKPGLFSRFDDRQFHPCYRARVAIRKAVDLLGLKPGDEVLFPAYHCGSDIDPLLDAGLDVRLYRVGETTSVDIEDIERLVGPQTKAVVLTHYFGFLQPQGEAIAAFCRARGLRLIEDCSLSLLSGVNPPEGRLGDVAIFCFHKFAGVNEGAALVLNSSDLPPAPIFNRPAPLKDEAKLVVRAGLATLFGFAGAARIFGSLRRAASSSDDALPGRPEMPPHYYFEPDLKDRAMGPITRAVVNNLDVGDVAARRRANFARYLERFKEEPGIRPLFGDLPAGVCPQSMPVRVAQRDRIARDLQAQGIAATAWWSGYNRKVNCAPHPEACALKDSVLSLPCHQGLETEAIDHICDVLKDLAR